MPVYQILYNADDSTLYFTLELFQTTITAEYPLSNDK
jgi:hypothetical protein